MRKNVATGQVGLLLLVIMGVVVALVMSVASRSLSDTVLSRQERESSAAFSVAETGIESAMNALRDPGVTNTSGNLSGLSGFVTGQYAVAPTTTYGLYVKEGETAQLDLTGFSGALTISWTKKNDVSENPATCNEGTGGAPAAIELKQVKGSLPTPTVSFAYYNPNGCTIAGNGFASSDAGTDPYRSSIVFTPDIDVTVLRIKPIYSGATISVSGAGLKNQLFVIQSQAAGGDAHKEIEVRRGLDAPPSIFDFAIFSAGTIVK